MSLPEITLLGGIEVHRAGAAVPVAGSRMQAVLAVLAVDAERVVPAETLASRAWGDQLPERVRASVQTSVWRLRTALGQGVITTEATGYRLAIPRSNVDAHAFAARCDAARAEADPETERRLLGEALALWTGEPFAGEQSGWLTNVAATQMVDGYLRAVERRIDLDLAAGDTEGLDSELRGLLDRYQLRESLWLRLLHTLDAEGRTAEALQAYEQLRVLLADQLGADPAPELQDAHAALLTGSRGGRGAAAGTPAPHRTRRVPRQLPADIPSFVGRGEVLSELDGRLGADVEDSLQDASRGPRVAVLSGPAGSGKTSVAIHWSHRLASAFPDGQIFLNLRGFGLGEPTPVATALELVLRAIHVAGDRIPDGVDARAAMLRSELADRRLLLVLDDARDADHVRPLLPGGDNVVIVTSRNQLRGLVTREGAARVELGPMSPQESEQLLSQRVGPPETPTNGSGSSASLRTLARRCGYLPLALAIAAERAGRGDEISDVVAELGDEQGRLDALSGGEDPLSDLRGVFAVSYRALAPDAARAFRFLGLHPSSVVSAGAMGALLDLGGREVTRLLDQLVEANLLRRVRSGWFAVHDLLRLYAIDLLTTLEPSPAQDQARRRLISWCLHSAEAACLRLWRYPTAIETGPLLVMEPERFDTPRRADAWFAGHRAVLTDLVRQAAADGDHRTVCRLVPRLAWYLIRIGAGDEHLEMCRLAAEHARATEDATHVGGALNNLGIAYAMQGHSEQAGLCFEEARLVYDAAGDGDGVARVMNNVGALANRDREPRRAIHVLEAALTDRREAGDDLELCSLLRNLVNARARLGDLDRASALAAEMLDIASRHHHMRHEASAHDAVGTVQLAMGDPVGAAESYRAALALYRQVNDRPAVAHQLRELGEAEHAAGRDDAARRAWTEALEVLRDDQVTGRAGPAEEIIDLLAGLTSRAVAEPATSGARRR